MGAKEVLIEKGIRPSLLRTKVYEHLNSDHHHLSADEIFLSLKPEIYTLSKTSIYNTLSLFSEYGIVDEIIVSGNEKKYEISRSKHSHFVCKVCGSLYDIPNQEVKITNNYIEGNRVEDTEVLFRGVCKNCV